MTRRRPATAARLPGPAAASEPARLLFADSRLLVVAKPAGLSLATPRHSPGAAVERLLAALDDDDRWVAGAAPSAPLLVHRLDVGTSGLVVLARDPDTHRALVAAFGVRDVEKTYLALVWGHPRPRQGVIDEPLGPDRDDRRRMRVDPAGSPAVSGYRVLAAPPHVALVELSPQTGRTHQLRVHLAYRGHPIVGDDLYGGPRHRGLRDPRLREALAPTHTLLHAWRLVLPAPPMATELIVTAPLPAEFLGTCAALGIEPPG